MNRTAASTATVTTSAVAATADPAEIMDSRILIDPRAARSSAPVTYSLLAGFAAGHRYPFDQAAIEDMMHVWYHALDSAQIIPEDEVDCEPVAHYNPYREDVIDYVDFGPFTVSNDVID